MKPFKMCKLTSLFLLIFVLNPASKIISQEINKEYSETNERNSSFSNLSIYGSILHQHQDFFQKAFSFTGIEGGAILNDNYFVGFYGSTFLSILEIKKPELTRFLQIWQTGLVTGVIFKKISYFEFGALLKVGYISIIADESPFSLFKPENPSVNISGLVLAPQIFSEIQIAKWFKIRTGIAYEFCFIKEQQIISGKDLQNVSLNFGLIFTKL